MIRIYVEQVSERLLYVLDFVLKDRGLEYAVTNDELFFLENNDIRINYSEFELPGVTHLRPASVLFDEDIRKYSITTEIFEGEECICFNGIDDPLASIFYVLSRYEEYTEPFWDKHDRFDMSYSLQSRNGWLEKVMCDRWAEAFIRFIERATSVKLVVKQPSFQLIPTFDVDNTYAYLLKEGPRKWGATLSDYLKGNKLRLNERKQVFSGARRDPYDTFELIESIAESGYSVKVFWLLGDYRNFDRNITYRDPRHQRLIRRINRTCEVGIHPSYRSNNSEFLVRSEKERLESILDQRVFNSRQHFLKMRIPLTYHRLISVGIGHDFTMGMADRVGFRAGTSRSFMWFDLSKNIATQLVVHPFVYMDGTLNEYLRLSPEESKKKIHDLYQEVKRFGGDFTFIWHNETIGDYGKWEGWKEVLEYTLNLVNNE